MIFRKSRLLTVIASKAIHLVHQTRAQENLIKPEKFQVSRLTFIVKLFYLFISLALFNPSEQFTKLQINKTFKIGSSQTNSPSMI